VFIVPSKDLVISRHAMPSLLGSGFVWQDYFTPLVASFPDVVA